MNIISRISVQPQLPAAIARLKEIAFNLWWSWEPAAQALYAHVDENLWDAVNHNPVKFLQQVAQEKLDAAAANPTFVSAYHSVCKAFDEYMNPQAATWFGKHQASNQERVIAYFSAEFGLHEALPIYSGGLGVLSGDHCKEASDMGLPFIGVGFLYPQGYFTQRIDQDGRQQAEYEKIDFAEMPVTPAVDKEGKPVLINVDLPGRTVYAKVWRIQIGRIPIFLMDTDVERNAPQDRELSARLYGGDREMRISQEFVLGIGGVRAVRALGYSPAVWHMNEGHSAFLGLERVREYVQNSNLNFQDAVELVRASSIFTTHTPVPAGNDSFDFQLVEKFFWQYWGQLGINRDQFIGFARQEMPWGGQQYSMTVLALRLSGYANGVSKLHGEVSRQMWQFLYPGTPVSQVPIGHVTNGVHSKTWLQPELRDLYNKYLQADWLEEIDARATWNTDAIPDGELWTAHQVRKTKMVEFARTRMKRQYMRFGEGPTKLNKAASYLNPNALIIGFARRFATYKRATLLFRDEERLRRILNNPDRPVQFVFSGKAHPADEPGKGLIQHVYQMSQRPEFEGKILFIENYDMNVARHLVSGVDVWLNNPRRPHEASGTSGQKAALNGIPNFSVLDGWWVEGYDGSNGWSIGEEREYKDENTQDEADMLSLYTTLEGEIIPLFFDRGADGIPHGWVRVMKNAIRTCAPDYSMRRMLVDYVNQLYAPAMKSGTRFAANQFELAREINAWKSGVRQRWGSIHIEANTENGAQLTVGESVNVNARAWLNGIPESSIAVEAVYGATNGKGEVTEVEVVPLSKIGQDYDALLYKGNLTLNHSGRFALGVRMRPNHSEMINPYEMGLMRWA
ncbi:MAG: alpha-glucan family phosphorylase [Caldilineaceae bacterium]